MMKKVMTISAVLSIFAVTTANAQQEDRRDKFHIGAKAGINVSNVYDEEGDDFVADGKVGFAAGGFLEIPLGKFLGIQPEVLYAQKGFEATSTFSTPFFNTSYTFTRTTSHLDIPIQLQLKPAPFLTIVAGPQYSFLLSRKDEITSSDGTTTTLLEQEFENDNIRKNTLGAVGGIDINISHFVISGRAGWDLQNNDGDGSSTSPRYKNVWFQATLGFKL